MTDTTPTDPAALSAEVERLRAEVRSLKGHLGRVLYLYSHAWHPDSILMQAHKHELEAAHHALHATTHPEGRGDG